MRKNLPITSQEITIPINSVLISRTDMKGRISYVSQDFANISGFSEEEMLGEPHNLIRHPDVPSEIFREMWETIQDGNPWSGIIKNRAKSGDYYWVDATVTPVMNEGVISGYMSVRKKATEDQIRRAEILFSQLKNTKSFLWKLKEGIQILFKKLGLSGKIIVYALLVFVPLLFANFEWIRNGMIVLPMLGVSCGSVGILFLINTILNYRKEIREIISIQKEIVSGNFLMEIPEKKGNSEIFEIRSSLRVFVISIWGLLVQIKENFEKNQELYQYLSQSSEQFQSKTQNQAASVEQTASASHELSSTLDEIVKSIHLQSTGLTAINDGIGKVNESIQNVSKSMDNLSSQTSSVKEKASQSEKTFEKAILAMNEIKEYSNGISNIIGIITSISEKTNLLSLNASIESARAGEAGKGFSVVAEEISKLASQTRESIKDIVNLIDNTTKAVNLGAEKFQESLSIVKQLTDYIGEVNSSATIVRASLFAQAEKLGEIRKNTDQVNQLGETVSESSGFQKTASDEISLSMQNIAESSELIARTSGEIKQLVDESIRKAAKLYEILKHFKTS
ncbi:MULTISPECIES: methyl-accepting chemotaxis protein [Leptospira]|uniref:Methyl-accepting chemotaxis protein n=3 Tax=Leptospira interrogans TaxID=173 RepID=Q8F9Y8_LEPIN|nr:MULTISPECIES: PAS domain-containing methyl-accepting chemotaxis protein [Leptospira]AAN47248.1 methyl-accepting chemotaxis protein [Leptospira interrogans serovar Lai str. 56601]AER00865.1 methyl-accepting chemotaxis protein [Leptospira interrogans serovar Lai str. IPAV]QCO34855.1 methyl-accepting chemotaxis protein [Leptospira interrogans]QOI32815.1 PAS domain-containing protein [Leptospira interrogans serovar Icterohaemorrhagiae]QOI49063.1 PAS domain-containing protein [Leptospira interro